MNWNIPNTLLMNTVSCEKKFSFLQSICHMLMLTFDLFSMLSQSVLSDFPNFLIFSSVVVIVAELPFPLVVGFSSFSPLFHSLCLLSLSAMRVCQQHYFMLAFALVFVASYIRSCVCHSM